MDRHDVPVTKLSGSGSFISKTGKQGGIAVAG
jgi:hypothetical protein